MKTLAIIPARGGSKRIPGKNKRPFCGKPLIAWTIETALQVETIDRVIVSSDDEEILKIAMEHDARLPLRRPQSISGDQAPAIEYVKHAVRYLRDSERSEYDAIVILQPTSPLTQPEDVGGTLKLLETTGADSAVSVVKLDHAIHPIKMKILKQDRLFPYLEEENGRMAYHDLPEIYIRNCSVYASTIETIHENMIIGNDCRAYIMPRERSVDINDEIDFIFAEFLMEKRGL
ncbi:MAG: acylneuraminate cytidylyltransferase family protein [Desulfobacteraceae bacterium]|nr:MAG: acylneuraminate cytidylyltransferase family protein [Desulfobacteraceae bacterium]